MQTSLCGNDAVAWKSQHVVVVPSFGHARLLVTADLGSLLPSGNGGAIYMDALYMGGAFQWEDASSLCSKDVAEAG